MSDETDRKDDDRPQDSGDDHADLLTLEICFLGLVGLVVVAAFIEALGYKLVSSRTPFVIMAPLLILIAVQAMRLFRHRHEAQFGERLRLAMSGQMAGFNKVGVVSLWMVVLLGLIVVLGHYIGLGIFCFALLWKLGGVSVRMSIIVTLGTLAGIFLIFEFAFNLELYRGLVFRYFAGYRDF